MEWNAARRRADNLAALFESIDARAAREASRTTSGADPMEALAEAARRLLPLAQAAAGLSAPTARKPSPTVSPPIRPQGRGIDRTGLNPFNPRGPKWQ